MDRSPDVIMKNAPSSRSYTATFCAVSVSFPDVILVSAMPMSPCWVCIPRQKVIFMDLFRVYVGFAGCNGKDDFCIALPTSFNLACRSSRNSWSPSKMTLSITVYSRYAASCPNLRSAGFRNVVVEFPSMARRERQSAHVIAGY